ncbi:hypothetical protein DK842_04630 [Chromobacterium phragmitis]|uniref:Uncharacterized protein n=1 Tax=Chromobacterium phragmitis TaxID=2202141 RepID=A0A344UH73_9NEIS|nr:hypothetical protein [Chromobacterium phragmitis]AXE29262.1 hypothetical protein DK842_04630 [Chromobacterium phragmitis]AXE34621.1 hypothetical protein DK843_10095 [Chromobacterium phragmitis]
MNEVSDALSLATSRSLPQTDLPLYPAALATDGEALAYRPGSPQALPEGGCLSEALLPEIRLLALRLALRRGLPFGPTPARIAEPADWLAARILLLEWKQVELALDELTLLDEANRRARALAESLALAYQPALPVLLPAGREPGAMRGWRAQPLPRGGVAEASRRCRERLSARFAELSGQ